MKARFLMLWVAAVLAAGTAFVVHLALRFETVRLGYEVSAARDEERRLVEQQRLLAIEAATLRQHERIETIARGHLDMGVPETAQIVSIEHRAAARPAGRLR